MIISRTPFRISLVGGGTDFPEFFNKHEGKVIGFAIDKYCNIFFRPGNKLWDYNFRIVYSKIELAKRIQHIIHPSVRNTSLFYNYKKPYDLLHNGDLPAKTGLGTSSSFTVGMCKIFRTVLHRVDNPYLIAKDAIKVKAKVLWLQLDIRNEEAKKIVETNDIIYIENKCTKIEYEKYFN